MSNQAPGEKYFSSKRSSLAFGGLTPPQAKTKALKAKKSARGDRNKGQGYLPGFNPSRANSLIKIGDKAWSYGTAILDRLPDGRMIGNATKYGTTTSKHQGQAGIKNSAVTVTGVPIGTKDLATWYLAHHKGSNPMRASKRHKRCMKSVRKSKRRNPGWALHRSRKGTFSRKGRVVAKGKNPRRKGKRRAGPYALFVGRQMRAGKSMKQAAAAWRSR